MVHTAELLFPSQSLMCCSFHHQIVWANIAIGTTDPGIDTVSSASGNDCELPHRELMSRPNPHTMQSHISSTAEALSWSNLSLVLFGIHETSVKNTFNNHDKHMEQLWQIHANFSWAWLANFGTECMIVSDMVKHWSDLAGSDEKEKRHLKSISISLIIISTIYIADVGSIHTLCVFWRKGDTICVPFDPKHQNELFS